MAKVVVEVKCKDKVCPLCQEECIEPWETVCSRCWSYLSFLDQTHGTTYCQQIIDNKKVVIHLPPIIHRMVSIYYPLTPVERQERVRKITRKICSKCDKETGVGFEDKCWKCLWRFLMNEMLGNGKT